MQRRAYPEGAGSGLAPNGPYGEFRADALFTYFRYVPPLEPALELAALACKNNNKLNTMAMKRLWTPQLVRVDRPF